MLFCDGREFSRKIYSHTSLLQLDNIAYVIMTKVNIRNHQRKNGICIADQIDSFPIDQTETKGV